jgi:hypothetical protein
MCQSLEIKAPESFNELFAQQHHNISEEFNIYHHHHHHHHCRRLCRCSCYLLMGSKGEESCLELQHDWENFLVSGAQILSYLLIIRGHIPWSKAFGA